jgi:hypothetical protein
MRPWSALSNFWASLFRFRAALVGSQQLLGITFSLPCGRGQLSATFGHHFFASVRPWSALSNFWPSLFLFYTALVGPQQLLGITFSVPCGLGRPSTTFGHHFFAPVRPWSALNNFWASLFHFRAALVGSQQLLAITFPLPCGPGRLSATFGHHFFGPVRPLSALSNFWASLFRSRAALVGSPQLWPLLFHSRAVSVGSQQLLDITFPLPCGTGRLSATFGHHFFASVRSSLALTNFWRPWPPPSDSCAALADSQQLLRFELKFEANLEKISAR